jgi:hypothetical protein
VNKSPLGLWQDGGSMAQEVQTHPQESNEKK